MAVFLFSVIAAKRLDAVDPDSLPSPYVLLTYNGKVKSTDVATHTQRPLWRVGSDKSDFSLCVEDISFHAFIYSVVEIHRAVSCSPGS